MPKGRLKAVFYSECFACYSILYVVHLNRSLVGLLGIVIEKTDVAYLRSFPCVVVKKTFQVTCGDPETEVDLILSRASVPGRVKSIPKAY